MIALINIVMWKVLSPCSYSEISGISCFEGAYSGLCYFMYLFFLRVLGFELRASHFLDLAYLTSAKGVSLCLQSGKARD
jgi:hypothetical protein